MLDPHPLENGNKKWHRVTRLRPWNQFFYELDGPDSQITDPFGGSVRWAEFTPFTYCSPRLNGLSSEFNLNFTFRPKRLAVEVYLCQQLRGLLKTMLFSRIPFIDVGCFGLRENRTKLLIGAGSLSVDWCHLYPRELERVLSKDSKC